jgi:flavin reductase (DIM6/NTAB) family NADH-FMN oxidoreductase RutF
VVEAILPVGDHTLVVGRIVRGGVARDAEPLTSIISGWVYSG